MTDRPTNKPSDGHEGSWRSYASNNKPNYAICVLEFLFIYSIYLEEEMLTFNFIRGLQLCACGSEQNTSKFEINLIRVCLPLAANLDYNEIVGWAETSLDDFYIVDKIY